MLFEILKGTLEEIIVAIFADAIYACSEILSEKPKKKKG